MASDVPNDEPPDIAGLIGELTGTQRGATPSELARLRQYFASRVLPEHPTARVYAKHAKHIDIDLQWPNDTTPDEYLESLRATIVNPRTSIYLVEAEIERTWIIYFVGPVRHRWRGRYPGHRIVVLFNAERHVWITGFQARDGDSYVDSQGGFWIYRPR